LRYIIFAITFLLSLTLQSDARAIRNALRGLTKIVIVVEQLDSNSIECGLTKDAIRDAVLYPVSAAKFHVVNDDNDPLTPTLYVNTISLLFRPEELCVTHVALQAYAIQVVTLEFSGEQVLSEINLWDDGGICSTPRWGHARRVTETLERYAKRFVTNWNLDNKSTENR
jgi:hypothetical protein